MSEEPDPPEPLKPPRPSLLHCMSGDAKKVALPTNKGEKEHPSSALDNLRQASRGDLRGESNRPPTVLTSNTGDSEVLTIGGDGFANTRIRVRRQDTDELERSMKASAGIQNAPSFHVDVLKSFGGGADTSSAATVAAQVLIDVVGLDKLQESIAKTLKATGVELPRYQVSFKDFTLAPNKGTKGKDQADRKDEKKEKKKTPSKSTGAAASGTPKAGASNKMDEQRRIDMQQPRARTSFHLLSYLILSRLSFIFLSSLPSFLPSFLPFQRSFVRSARASTPVASPSSWGRPAPASHLYSSPLLGLSEQNLLPPLDPSPSTERTFSTTTSSAGCCRRYAGTPARRTRSVGGLRLEKN